MTTLAGPAPSPTGSGPFTAFALAQFAAFTGLWAQKAAVGWLAWDLTHSPAFVGAVALSDMIAALGVGPLSGSLADRTSAFHLIAITQSIIGLNTVLLFTLVSTASITPVILIAWAIFDACVQTFNQPVRIVVIGSLAPKGRTGQAIAANSVAVNLGRIAGPAVGGMLMLHVGVSFVFVLTFVLYATMITVVLLLRQFIARPKMPAAGVSLIRGIGQGISYIRADARLSLLFVLVLAFSLLARPFAELLPALAGGTFDGGPGTLAWLMSAQGIGALFGAVWLLRPKSPHRLAVITGISAIGIGSTLVLFSLASSMTLVLLTIGFAGLFHVLCNIGMQTNAQTISSESMRGRVVGFYWLIFRAAPAIGAFSLGLLAEWFDLQVLIGMAAGVFLLVVLALLAPARRIFQI